MEDEERLGRPKNSRTEATSHVVYKLTVDGDKRRTNEVILIPHSTVHRILWMNLERSRFFRNGFCIFSQKSKGRRGSADGAPIFVAIEEKMTS